MFNHGGDGPTVHPHYIILRKELGQAITSADSLKLLELLQLCKEYENVYIDWYYETKPAKQEFYITMFENMNLI